MSETWTNPMEGSSAMTTNNAAAPVCTSTTTMKADRRLAALRAYEDANYDALANEDEAEALNRRHGSQQEDSRARSFWVPRFIGWVARGLFGFPAGKDRIP
jgi:hypothetical protein